MAGLAPVAPAFHLLRLAPSAAIFSLVVGCSGTPVAPSPAPNGPPPARLTIDAPPGADIHVDDVFVGVTPLPAPVDAEPGWHHVEVTSNGHKRFARSLELERGKTRTLTAELEETGQRKAAWALIGSGGALLSGGIVLGVLSVVEQRKARDLQDEADGEDLSERAQADYDDAIAARDGYRVGSGITAGTALGLFVLGGVLFGFDAPERRPTLTLVPSLSPGSAAGNMTLRF
ncbi:MAG: PEGA domain-containing protein [Myxococcales bacterium]|nr:PEGA domain-containing protein [Myxococcales bacterium]